MYEDYKNEHKSYVALLIAREGLRWRKALKVSNKGELQGHVLKAATRVDNCNQSFLFSFTHVRAFTDRRPAAKQNPH